MMRAFVVALLLACFLANAALGLKGPFQAAIQATGDETVQKKSAAPPAGEITSLLGYDGKLRSRHYGGYITVDEENDRNLYYYLVESEGAVESDPVVLWLNGGPGCSSFDGFIYEHGPFLFGWGSSSKVQLRDNPYAWNKVATMIFLDSPSAVGLSFSGVEGDYSANDTATAADSNTFLRKFFNRYPHLKNNDFYIAGESYAGIYVPMLTREVVEGNRRGQKPHINIKGYLVGNGCTDAHFDGNAQVPFAVGKSLIPLTLFLQINQACGSNYYDPQPGSRCEVLLSKVNKDLSHLNLYNILEECHHKSLAPAGAAAVSLADLLQQNMLYQQLREHHQTWPITGVVRQGSKVKNWAQLGLLGHNPPCTLTTEADAWLNDPAVRDALHAASTDVTGPWTICSDRIDYTADAGSMLPIHKQLTRDRGLRALIYSGDHDLCVPHTGSEAWTAAIHRKPTQSKPTARSDSSSSSSDDAAEAAAAGVVTPWQPWFNSESPKPQVAGYMVEYDSGMTYATVKGAGHMVPQSKPLDALDMFSRFIRGQSLQHAPCAAQPTQQQQEHVQL
eukprot:GHUV01001609.1.p1 GENE.GHUV01001609.1~~GHUV01001609.1.p1  ORF type:complete len:561 (+),score=169.12 GHUV01001609.1:237-1919(+)